MGIAGDLCGDGGLEGARDAAALLVAQWRKRQEVVASKVRVALPALGDKSRMRSAIKQRLASAVAPAGPRDFPPKRCSPSCDKKSTNVASVKSDKSKLDFEMPCASCDSKKPLALRTPRSTATRKWPQTTMAKDPEPTMASTNTSSNTCGWYPRGCRTGDVGPRTPKDKRNRTPVNIGWSHVRIRIARITFATLGL